MARAKIQFSPEDSEGIWDLVNEVLQLRALLASADAAKIQAANPGIKVTLIPLSAGRLVKTLLTDELKSLQHRQKTYYQETAKKLRSSC
jgi:hypothetical protein